MTEPHRRGGRAIGPGLLAAQLAVVLTGSGWALAGGRATPASGPLPLLAAGTAAGPSQRAQGPAAGHPVAATPVALSPVAVSPVALTPADVGLVAGDPGVVNPVVGDPAANAAPAPAVRADTGPEQRAVPAAVAAAAPAVVAATGAGTRSALSVTVTDALSGRVLAATGAAALVPASTLKLLTATAVLRELGPAAQLSTLVVGSPPDASGAISRAVLDGGGDPTLSREQLAGLAADLASRHVRRVAALSAGTDLFDGAATAPGWKATYVSQGAVAPVSALELDGGRTPGLARAADPAGAALGAFATALRAAGITVGSVTAAGPPPAQSPGDGVLLAAASSAPVASLVSQMLLHSDNDLAECLGRLAAGRAGLPADAAGEAALLTRTAAGFGAGPVTLFDASGLSVLDRLPPMLLATVLRRAATGDRALGPLLAGLPVAGQTGTLTQRYRSGPAAAAAGRVAAKTGSLEEVAAEAGVLRNVRGRLLVVTAYLEGPGAARAVAALDALVAAVAQAT